MIYENKEYKKKEFNFKFEKIDESILNFKFYSLKNDKKLFIIFELIMFLVVEGKGIKVLINKFIKNIIIKFKVWVEIF